MSISGALGFNKKRSSSTKQEETVKSGTRTSQLELDDAAIKKIIEDVLGSESGLASIFGGEQTAGIFDSSVAAQASGDLAANLVGELAKLTGKTTEAFDEEGRSKGSSSGKGSGFTASLSGVPTE